MSEKKDKWAEGFEEFSEYIREWRQENPEATLSEIEEAVDSRIAQIRTEMVEDLAQEGRTADLTVLREEERPRCPQCGRPLVANLRLLGQKAKNEEQEAEVDTALFYIQTRLEMMGYAHFQKRGYPIGSGSVESGHKVVTHRRLKGAGMRWAGMRWAKRHVDPLLALRDLLCNDRWEEGWQEMVTHQQEQRRNARLQKAQDKQPLPSAPVTFASLEAAGLLPDEDPSDPPSASDEPATEDGKPWRPADDHPWRNDKWPTREAWRMMRRALVRFWPRGSSEWVT